METAWKRIEKRPGRDVAANLAEYERLCRELTWESARRELSGLPAGGLNIAHEAVTRHAEGVAGEQVALRFLRKGGEVLDLTYGALERQSNRFANALAALGLQRGERVFALLGRTPELYLTILGALKGGQVFCPLYPAFGPEPIRQRLSLGEGRVLVTNAALYRQKVAPLRAQLPALRYVLLVDGEGNGHEAPGDGLFAVRDLDTLLAVASDRFAIPATDPEEPALLHFTSGTTGLPKGAVHVHGAVVAHAATARSVLDLRPGDTFWCTADPGWVTGTSYGIVAPLVQGITTLVDEGDFDAERWYATLEWQGVTVWYTAPTAIRVLMKAGTELARRHRFPRLRHIASVGEPLNPEAVVWGEEAFGLPIHDNWWQTETGAIMIANFPTLDVKPGSMGLPVPGVEAAIVRRTPDGGVEALTAPDEVGELALRPGWPSMFRTYLGEEERYRRCFAGGWYLSGDLARRDAEGYYWFVGRGDDVIKSSGHLIGPFEVESVLMEHPAVAEAGVIGKPDPISGERVKAFVVLKRGFEPSEALRLELVGHARKRLGAAVAPKEIAFVPDLPKTRSGKVMRRLLKARELGLPEGDLSTLEVAA